MVRSARLIVPRGRVRLRPPRRSDARDWSFYRIFDEESLRPVEPTRSEDWATAHQVDAFRRHLRLWRREQRRGHSVSAVIEVDGSFAGMVTLGAIVPFPVAQAWVGYWVASDYAGGGVATAALALACDYGLGVGLHRIEATVRADNAASARVLRRCGFEYEGVAREAFHMDGQWRDHQVFARVSQASAVSHLVASGFAEREAAEKFP